MSWPIHRIRASNSSRERSASLGPSQPCRTLVLGPLMIIGLLVVACSGSGVAGNGVATLAPGADSAPAASSATEFEPGRLGCPWLGDARVCPMHARQRRRELPRPRERRHLNRWQQGRHRLTRVQSRRGGLSSAAAGPAGGRQRRRRGRRARTCSTSRHACATTECRTSPIPSPARESTSTATCSVSTRRRSRRHGRRAIR